MGDYFNIRYSELRFTVRLVNDSELPRFKASAIRGGMGDMLLDEYCIREELRRDKNSKCEECDFLKECIVQKILYSEMDITPAFMSYGNSVGYIVECMDMREFFSEGELLQFKLILFGKNCFYLSQYLSAIYRLGIYGLGKDRCQFEVVSVKNMRNEDILVDNNVIKSNYRIKYVSDYVDWRINKLNHQLDSSCFRIKYNTPLSIKKNGGFLKEIDIEDLYTNLRRRIFIMNCFEGNDFPDLLDKIELNVNQLNGENRPTRIPRYSFRKNQKILLDGVYGFLDVDISEMNDSESFLKELIAGELIHVGSNTSFGFGGYYITEI